MLNEEMQNLMAEKIVNRIEKLNSLYLTKIGEAIKKIKSLTPSQAYQLGQILKYGGSYNEITNELEKVSNLSQKDIELIYEQVAKDNQGFAKQFYEYKNIDFIPYKDNIILQQQVKAMAEITNKTFNNLSRTTGFMMIDNSGKKIFNSLSQTYQNVIDEAITSIAQGKEAYSTAMRRTMKQLADSGIRQIDYTSGYSRRLDTSVRQNILDGMRELSNKVQQDFGKEFDADGVEISVHSNPAEDHENIQGKQYSLNGDVIVKGKKYKDFNTMNNSLDRQISTLNCYHYIFSIVLGVSKPQYSQEQLNKIKEDNEQGFEFEGLHYTNYEGTQLQRKIETAIRKNKDRQIIGRASDDSEIVNQAQEQITLLTNKYNKLSKASNLPTKLQRLSVSKYHRVKVKN